MKKRLLSLLLVLSMLLGVFAMTASAEEPSAAFLYDLRVEDLVNPIGVDVPDPAFSWKMESDAIGAAQTAYAITVTDGEATMWDSGWVEDDRSVAIPYAGSPLQPSTRYDVAVRVKDEKGLETEAVTGYFETSLMSADAFDDVQWISYNANSTAISTTTSYTIDFDFVLEGSSQGFCFGMKDTGTFVMWQLNAWNERNGSKAVLLRPHFKSNGGWTAYPGLAGSTLEAKDVTEAIGYNTDTIRGKTIHERIVVDGRNIKTYFGEGDSMKLAYEYTHTAEVPLNNLGFRHFSSAAESCEIASYDNFVVTDGSGNVLYAENFDDGDAKLQAGHSYYKVVDGALRVGADSYVDEQISMLVAGEVGNPNSLPAYRKSFQIEDSETRQLVSAKLYTSGLGVYEAFVNGSYTTNLDAEGNEFYEELKPGFTLASKRLFYNSYDITHLVQPGENVLSAIVTSGWWSGSAGQIRQGNETAFLAKLLLNYSDGTTETIVTDTSWKAAKVAPVLEGTGIYQGERYDNRISTDWKYPGYDDANWGFCKVNKEFRGELVAWEGATVISREDLTLYPAEMYVYEGVTGASDTHYGTINKVAEYQADDEITLEPGQTLLVNFGQNFAGSEGFYVQAPAGTTINVEHGEWRNDGNGAKSRGCDGPEGSIYNANYRSATANTQYIASGNGYEWYVPLYTFYGFQYAAFTADQTVTISDITGYVTTSVHEDTTYLETSNADVNQLISNVFWGMYSNYLSIATDCPQRDERQGWTADTQIFSETGLYLGRNKSFLEKMMQDIADSQISDPNNAKYGAYTEIAPKLRTYFADGDGGTGWADAGIIIPYNLYVMTGDVSVIERWWDSMELYMDYLSRQEYGPTLQFGDWLHYEPETTTSKQIYSVAYYAWDARMMSEMAAAMGNTEAAAKYQAVYENRKAFFIEKFVREDGTLVQDGQAVALHALYIDLLPNEESVAAVTDQLISNIERNGNRLQTGFLGTGILMNTLTKIGRNDVAYKLLLQDQNPSWLYSVDQGATTTWERWNTYTLANGFGDVGMNSFNHYAYGAVVGWMVSDMAGIDHDPAEPGFKHILLEPNPDRSIEQVYCTFDSPYGRIKSDMAYLGNKWYYDAKVPANTTATISLPLEAADVTIRVAEGKEGLTYVGTENGRVVYEAVAGEYTFILSREEKAMAKDEAEAALAELSPFTAAPAITEENKESTQQKLTEAEAAVQRYLELGGAVADLQNYGVIEQYKTALAVHDSMQIDTFTIDFDFILEEGAQGFVFGAKDFNNMHMWQINAFRNKNGSKHILLRPHTKTNGGWAAHKDIDISSFVDFDTATILGQKIHQRIEVADGVVKTYFGSSADDLSLANTYDYQNPITLHNVGFRQNTDSNEGAERVKYDNVVIRDGAGNVVFAEDFSQPENVVIYGNASYYGFADGMISIGTTVAASDQVYLLAQKPGDGSAAVVDALIDAIDLTDKATVEEARAAYNALSPVEKQKVTKLDKLLTAESDLAVMESIVKLEMTGPDAAGFDPVTYTISAKEMQSLANYVLTVEYSEHLNLTAVEGAENWVVEYKEETGKVQIGGLHLTGASGDADLLKLTFEPVESGEAEVRVTKADLTAFTSDNELFVGKDLTNAFVQLLVNCNPYDVNRDGVINQLDLTRAQRYYGSDDPIADFNGDGRVAIDDLILLLTQILG